MKDRTILIILLALVLMVACVIAIIVIYMMLGAFFPQNLKKLTFAHGFRRKKNNDFPSTAISR
jgi:flagellar basal body-associated protein FliL